MLLVGVLLLTLFNFIFFSITCVLGAFGTLIFSTAVLSRLCLIQVLNIHQ